METIKLRDEFIKLGQALKLAGLCESGVEAKFAVQEGQVLVNGVTETQRAKFLDFQRFGSPIAYTLDGDHLGYYIDNTFYASGAALSVHGLSVHTGTAKGIMRNAADIAMEFQQMLPALEKPQYTSDKEGFYHVTGQCPFCHWI